jgi:hypothetical protein
VSLISFLMASCCVRRGYFGGEEAGEEGEVEGCGAVGLGSEVYSDRGQVVLRGVHFGLYQNILMRI